MEVKQRESGEDGAFFIEQNGREVADLTYFWDGDQRIVLAHSEVAEELRGQGAGKQLVAAAVEFARERGITLVPICPYAKSVIERVPEYQDVLP